MRKFGKYLRIGILCGWRVIFEYFQWILPCSRNPKKKPLSYRYAKARSLVVFLLRHMNIDFVNVDVSSFQSDRPVLHVCNHQSAIDPLMYIAMSPRPVSFISKKENAKIIVAGRLIKAIDGVFIDREDPRQAIRAFREAKANMEASGVSYCIFPEGTRQRDVYSGIVQDFKPGSLKLAYMTKAPILVSVQFGSIHAFDRSSGKGRYFHIELLHTYEYEDYKDLTTVELSRASRELIQKRLPEITQEDRAYFAAKKNKQKPMKWWKNVPALI